MIYFIRRKYKQIRNLIRWLPTIWKLYDFDYRSTIDVFSFQLKNTSRFFKSNGVKCVGAKERAMRIDTVLKLIDKVYNEEYAMEYLDIIEKKYGKYNLKFVEFDPINKLSRIVEVWDKNYTPDEIKKIKEEQDELFLISRAKQKKAHKLLWKLIEHNIEDWWD